MDVLFTPPRVSSGGDLRARVLDAVLTEQMPYCDTAERFRVSKAWVTKIVCRFRLAVTETTPASPVADDLLARGDDLLDELLVAARESRRLVELNRYS